MLITLIFFSFYSICWLFIILFKVISDAIKYSKWYFRFFPYFDQICTNICPKNYEWLVILPEFIKNLHSVRFGFEFILYQWRTTILHKIKYTLEEKKALISQNKIFWKQTVVLLLNSFTCLSRTWLVRLFVVDLILCIGPEL